ncbi:hypothetical protein D7X94_06010 [Acutalibacter sp. 1XD8-33]|uniref:hypothetical protein n=1 Tax=Acutalibacter sp. 1XD8-33 TaxID=2320081 RepID=UPI000EA2D3C6|nr:hypothetical protein [Acutalibacter sp. 1XD8-33]RKJ40953.1 hypothetical protein D7X94_06010 [Acutalibacter sp. 1XD8-33]
MRCFFIGHRDAPGELLEQLIDQVERQVEEAGIQEFLVGGYGGYDRMAAQAVTHVKKRRPEVTLLLLLPYHPAQRQVDLLPDFDGSLYPPGLERTPRRYAIVKANHYGVDSSQCLIAYAWKPGSNAVKLVEYAEGRKDKWIIRLR